MNSGIRGGCSRVTFALTDYEGIAFLITSIGTFVTVIVGAIVTLRQTKQVKDNVEQIHDAVKTSNGTTIGQITEANEIRRVEGEA